jgi:hypothetical protein
MRQLNEFSTTVNQLGVLSKKTLAVSVTLNQQSVQRIRGEYLEMPGLRLRLDQVQRVCGVDRAAKCGSVESKRSAVA